MRNWKLAFIAAVALATVAFTLVHIGPGSGGHVSGQSPVAAQHAAPASGHAGTPPIGIASDDNYGWGPFRTVDW